MASTHWENRQKASKLKAAPRFWTIEWNRRTCAGSPRTESPKPQLTAENNQSKRLGPIKKETLHPEKNKKLQLETRKLQMGMLTGKGKHKAKAGNTQIHQNQQMWGEESTDARYWTWTGDLPLNERWSVFAFVIWGWEYPSLNLEDFSLSEIINLH